MESYRALLDIWFLDLKHNTRSHSFPDTSKGDSEKMMGGLRTRTVKLSVITPSHKSLCRVISWNMLTPYTWVLCLLDITEGAPCGPQPLTTTSPSCPDQPQINIGTWQTTTKQDWLFVMHCGIRRGNRYWSQFSLKRSCLGSSSKSVRTSSLLCLRPIQGLEKRLMFKEGSSQEKERNLTGQISTNLCFHWWQ